MPKDIPDRDPKEGGRGGGQQQKRKQITRGKNII